MATELSVRIFRWIVLLGWEYILIPNQSHILLVAQFEDQIEYLASSTYCNLNSTSLNNSDRMLL